MAVLLAAAIVATSMFGAQSEPSEEVVALAAEAGISDPLQLMGALNSQPGVDAREYLIFDGKLARPVPPSLREYAYANHPDVAGCIEQIVRVESNGWYTGGYNPVPVGREHASGLGGFLPSTWASTPQGRAGESIWDGTAQVDAIAWMIHQGRGGEFAAYLWGRCR